MKTQALFINGVYESVLQEILAIQSELPEQILFLQPYKNATMRALRDDPPSVEDPMRLYVSLTDDLPTVRYSAEIVGWNDKRQLSISQRAVLNRIIAALQPGETGLYDAATGQDPESINLLFIRRLEPLNTPFPVGDLIKISDDEPLSDNRTRAGGWSYVKPVVPQSESVK